MLARKLFVLLVILVCLAPAGRLTNAAEGDSFLLQAGYQFNQVQLENLKTGDKAGSLSGPDSFSAEGSPVFSIASKTFFTDAGCILGGPGGTPIAGCVGLGLRFGGGQRRFAGEWFASQANPNDPVTFDYNATQAFTELLLGALSEITPVVGIGLKAGFNDYDLLVRRNDSILIRQTDEGNFFLSTTYYVNLVILIDLLFGLWPSSPPLNNLAIEFSVEETNRGKNAITVPDINGPGSSEVDFHTRTNTITFQYFF